MRLGWGYSPHPLNIFRPGSHGLFYKQIQKLTQNLIIPHRQIFFQYGPANRLITYYVSLSVRSYIDQNCNLLQLSLERKFLVYYQTFLKCKYFKYKVETYSMRINGSLRLLVVTRDATTFSTTCQTLNWTLA